MSDAAAAPPADALDPTGFSSLLLNLSVSGVLLMRPRYEADGEIVDFDGVRLNPAAQQMLRLPECPAESFLTLYPTAKQAGVFDFYRKAFRSDTVARRQNLYQLDGLDGYYLLVAQRYQDLLVVSFTDTNDQPRSAVEDALRESQAREQQARAAAERLRGELAYVVARAPVAMGLLRGANFIIELANTRMSQLWGRPAEQLLGQPHFKALPDLAGQGFEQVLQDVLTTGQALEQWEQPILIAQPEQLYQAYLNITYLPEYDASGQPTGILIYAVDVTEQVRARQQVEQLNVELEARVQARTQQLTAALADTERQRAYWANLFEQAPMAMTVLRGPELVVEMANAAVCRLWGRALTQVLDRPLFEATPETAGQGFEQVLAGVLRTGQPFVVTEAPVYLPQGPAGALQLAYVNVSYHALRDEGDGRPRLIAYGTDVTEQVLARRAREAQQQLVSLVFEQAPLPVFVATGPTFVLEVINAQAARLFHKTRAQLLGLPYADAFPEFMQQGFGELLRDIWQSGQARTFTDVPVYFLNRPPQEPGYFTFVYQPLLDAQGQVHGIVCVGIEVTDQVLARQQVQRLNEELAALNEELTATNEELNASNTQLTRTNVDLDTFVYTASHDLKAPITNIESITLALRDTLPAAVQQDDMISHLLALLEQTTTRFQTTIGQLTDLSKLQLAHAGPAEPVGLAAIIEAVRLDLALVILAADAQLTVAVAPNLLVSFSPGNLRSAVYNLLSNAVKYRALDRPAQVQVRAFPAGGRVVLEVQDNGLGLNAHQQSRLFGLFQRLHTHVEGTGVGLYTIKRLVENGGGTIAVQSQVDVGTTFTLTFPA